MLFADLFKINFFSTFYSKTSKEHYQSVSLDPDQTRHFVGTGLEVIFNSLSTGFPHNWKTEKVRELDTGRSRP